MANAATDNTDALVLFTEWKEFRAPDFATSLCDRAIFDGRNIDDPAAVAAASLRVLLHRDASEYQTPDAMHRAFVASDSPATKKASTRQSI